MNYWPLALSLPRILARMALMCAFSWAASVAAPPVPLSTAASSRSFRCNYAEKGLTIMAASALHNAVHHAHALDCSCVALVALQRTWAMFRMSESTVPSVMRR